MEKCEKECNKIRDLDLRAFCNTQQGRKNSFKGAGEVGKNALGSHVNSIGVDAAIGQGFDAVDRMMK